MISKPEPTMEELKWVMADPERRLVVGDWLCVATPMGRTPVSYVELSDPEIAKMFEGQRHTPDFVLNCRIRCNPALEAAQKAMSTYMNDSLGEEPEEGLR